VSSLVYCHLSVHFVLLLYCFTILSLADEIKVYMHSTPTLLNQACTPITTYVQNFVVKNLNKVKC